LQKGEQIRGVIQAIAHAGSWLDSKQVILLDNLRCGFP